MRVPVSVSCAFCVLVSLAAVSCQSVMRPSAYSVEATAAALVDMHEGEGGGQVRGEAEEIARVAHLEAQRLAARYGVGTPSWMHNCLVNTGVRERGLCWHYMEDLYAVLFALRLEYHDVHCGVRDSGRLFHEHHGVVLTARGAAFETGVVLDPWKKAGKLLHFPVRGRDRPWVEDAEYGQFLLKRESR